MNLTQSARKANLKRWKAQKPAVIGSPLKVIHERFPDRKLGGRTVMHPIYATAFHAANRGDGVTVKKLARLPQAVY